MPPAFRSITISTSIQSSIQWLLPEEAARINTRSKRRRKCTSASGLTNQRKVAIGTAARLMFGNFTTAALDAYATLLLYENQRGRNLNGASGLRRRIDSAQNLLPLDAESVGIEPKTSRVLSSVEKPNQQPELTDEAVAILGIITELPSRYNPDGLAASIGSERVGLAG